LNFYRDNLPLFGSVKDTPNSLEQKFEVFNNEAFKMLWPDPKKNQELSSYIGIQLIYPAGVDGAAIVNGLVASSVSSERERIADDLNALIRNRLNQLEMKAISMRAKYEAEKEAQIATLLEADDLKRATLQDELQALREEIKTQRMNRIETLSEAIEIAKALGIEKPTTPSAQGEKGNVATGNSFKAEINNQSIPLYFLGHETLEAERQILLKRLSDDFSEPRIAGIKKELRLLEHNRMVEILKQRENEVIFVEEQAVLRGEIAHLGNLQIDLSDISLVTVDQQAVEPIASQSPKIGIVLILSVVLGLLLGVFVAAIRSNVERIGVSSK
jgi:LPS O-antigen subunit length determinant protein (WzzB/FepE family)